MKEIFHSDNTGKVGKLRKTFRLLQEIFSPLCHCFKAWPLEKIYRCGRFGFPAAIAIGIKLFDCNLHLKI